MEIEEALQDGSQGKRFHLADCSTLQNMKNNGRFERYVVKNSINHNFLISGKNNFSLEVEGETKLDVCINCLKQLDYNDYNDESYPTKKSIVSNFSLKEFFEEYKTFFTKKPSRNESSDVQYSTDWKETSRKYREENNWTCEDCNVNLHEHKNLLDTHHMNGVKSDNSPSNLKALCRICHSEQVNHEHMKVSSSDEQIISKALLQTQKTKPERLLAELLADR